MIDRRAFDIALMEGAIAIRGGWVRAFGFVFASGVIALSLVTAATGAGFAGFGFDRATATALSLMLLAAPLISVVVGVNTMAGSRAMWEMLASQAVTIPSVVAGKWFGVSMGVGGAVALSFGLSGLLLYAAGDGGGAGSYAVLGLTGVLLVGSFTGIGTLVGAAVTERSRALLIALLAWLLLVFFYDWAVIGVALITGKRLAIGAVWAVLMLNPVDLARVITIAGIGALDLLGPTGAVLARAHVLTYPALWLGLLLWAVLPMVIAGRVAAKVER